MRTDVKIGIVLGLLVVAAVVVYFSFISGGPDDGLPDDQTARKPGGPDGKVEIPKLGLGPEPKAKTPPPTGGGGMGPLAVGPRESTTPGTPSGIGEGGLPVLRPAVEGAGTAGESTTPGTSGELTTPGTVGEVTTPGTSGELTTPGTVGEVTTPGTSGELTRPGTVGEATTPGTSGERTTPGTVGEVTTPGTSGELTRPGTIGEVTTPGTSGESRTAPSATPSSADVTDDRPWFGPAREKTMAVRRASVARPGAELAAPGGTGEAPPDAMAPRVGGVRPGAADLAAGREAGTEPGALAEPVGGAARTYTVQPGDGLWVIAKKFYGRGKYWPVIEQANPDVDRTNLTVGAKLKIPSLPASRIEAGRDDVAERAAAAPLGSTVYTIKKGENPWTIARDHYGSGALSKLIIDANPKINAKALREGQKIILPPKPAGAARAVGAVGGGEITPVDDGSGTRHYRIKPSDTLSTIAEAVYGSSRHWTVIRDANPTVNPRSLKVGSVLVIPPLKPTGGTGVGPSQW